MNSIFQKQRSNQIKGIAAICVMLSHFLQGEGVLPLFRIINDGAIWVGVFFLLSGYGLQWSLQHKDNYLQGFWKKRILALYLPFVFAETVYTGILIWRGHKMTGMEIVCSCLGIHLQNPILWYVIHIILCYILFCLISKYISSKLQAVVWFVCYVVYLLTAVLCDLGNWWYLSTFAFLVGLWIAKNPTCYKEWKKRLRWLIWIGIILLLAILEAVRFQWVYVPGLPVNYLITALYLMIIPVFGVWLDDVISIFGAKTEKKGGSREVSILSFLGNISYEIYLWQIPVRDVLGRWISFDNVYGNAAFLSMVTVGFAFVLFQIRKLVETKCLGRLYNR